MSFIQPEVCTDTQHVLCSACGSCLRVGRYEDVRVNATDEEGFPSIDRDTGEIRTVLIPLPLHVLTHVFRDETALVGVFCEHGIKNHPNPTIDTYFKRKGARSFVRSRYSIPSGSAAGRCVVDEGAVRPHDLTTPLNEAVPA